MQALAFSELVLGGLFLTSAITGESMGELLTQGLTPSGKEKLHAKRTGKVEGESSASSLPESSLGAGYVNPVPGGKAGRTDMGVDVTGTVGQPIRAIAKSRVVGIQQNWYAGQPFVWMEILEGKLKGQFWYAAEQITPAVKANDVVQKGQAIGHYAPTGTALELGLATKSGQTLAKATTGYTEGQVTVAGKTWRKILSELGL